ncbi:hypothetical protein [Wenjunlia tyrosinilytica]|uniref:Uncharacterized protein n=1 Tax=Wenjunlia tyrosinilytica TaxID=1544741 RepID=A0A918DZN1_9ACTN|nr:hypothetical protein [Wenjunlia tyrosinilytica]GGO94481.1 hypothetical protein GCM10012280_49490 [Wenjunlia tyrosinilytica]
MADDPGATGALLLITIWSQADSGTLCGRVIRTADIRSAGEPTPLTGRDAVIAVVEQWLDAYEALHDQSPAPPDGRE